MSDDETVRVLLTVGGGLAVVALLFALAFRMLRSAQDRLAKVLGSLASGDGDPYRGAPRCLERPALETGPDGPRLRFAFRDQRALLDFTAPRTTAGQGVAPRSFGGFDEDGGARTHLRFWIKPAREARVEPSAASVEGPWHPEARAHIENLQRLGYQRGVGLATSADGLFVVKQGWLGISVDADALMPFLDEVCALVSLHLEGRLFEHDDAARRDS